MPFPIQALLEGRRKPICAQAGQTVREALQALLANDFNQLPVVDESGTLVGIVSEQTILRTYFHSSGRVALLDLPVHHCQEAAPTLSSAADVLDALELLQDREHYALIVVEDGKPVGILTHYDMTHFFRSISEGMMLVQGIEETLGQAIDRVYSDPDQLDTALFAAFGPDRHDPTRPARGRAYLGFYDKMQLIADPDNWPHFEQRFAPRELFMEIMDNVRKTRNMLAHFQGRPDAVQYDALKLATDWLAARREPPEAGIASSLSTS